MRTSGERVRISDETKRVQFHILI